MAMNFSDYYAMCTTTRQNCEDALRNYVKENGGRVDFDQDKVCVAVDARCEEIIQALYFDEYGQFVFETEYSRYSADDLSTDTLVCLCEELCEELPN